MWFFFSLLQKKPLTIVMVDIARKFIKNRNYLTIVLSFVILYIDLWISTILSIIYPEIKRKQKESPFHSFLQ